MDKRLQVPSEEFVRRQHVTWRALQSNGLDAGFVFSDEHYNGDVPYLGGNTNITTEQVAGVVGPTGFHIVAGLEGGYVAEQLAQLASPSLPEPVLLIVGKLRMDPAQHAAWLDGEPIHLSAKEFTLLEYLAQRAGQVVSPQELVGATHGLRTDRSEAGVLLRPLILSLRRKLDHFVGDVGCIENTRGVGYRLTPP